MINSLTGSPDSILSHELIGLEAKIVESSCTSFEGLSGEVVLETKNMLTIRTAQGLKRISKRVANQIMMDTDFGACFISGSSLTGRPEDRVSRTN